MATSFAEISNSLHQSSSSTNSPSSSSGLGDSPSQFSSSMPNHQIEERRALQLAFELLNFNDSINNPTSQQQQQQLQNQQSSLLNNQHRNSIGSPGISSLNALSFGSNGNSFVQPPQPEDRSKKSQNTTECVPVPSSEHVAEIVGRQGCKIKALRAKTNTYIKTPVRGEEPVFVVTGRKEDVSKAKKEILSAAEHFSMIRAARKPPALNGLSGAKGGVPPSGPPMNIPGQVTIQIKVPVKIVGLVVGSKGQTIKNIQQQTHTYIVTPSRDKEPVFEVTGLPENVQQCRRQIEAHIALRTGNMNNMMGNSMNGVGNGVNGNLLANNDETVAPDLLQCLYNKGLESLFNYLEPNNGANDNLTCGNTLNGDCSQSSALVNGLGMNSCEQFLATNGTTMASSTGSNCSSSSSSTSSKSAVMIRPELINIWKSLGESIDCDEGIGESPNIWTLPNSNSVNSVVGSRASPSTSASPTDSLLTGNSMKRECLVCGDKEVTAALVPCGHNLFCLDCANRICGPNGDHLCPVCSQIVIQAIRIIA